MNILSSSSNKLIRYDRLHLRKIKTKTPTPEKFKKKILKKNDLIQRSLGGVGIHRHPKIQGWGCNEKCIGY